MSSLQKFSIPRLAVGGCIALLVVLGLNLCLGAVPLGGKDFLAILQGDTTSAAARILLFVRIPRTLAALAAGAALAGAGVVIQTVLGNPLAGPNIIGVNAGAGFFATLCCWVFPAAVGLVPFAAFFGALLAVLLVNGIAKKTSTLTLVLAGVAINSLFGAGTDLIYTISPEALLGGVSFKIGGFAAVSAPLLLPAGCLIFVALVLCFLFHNEADILALGETAAASLGLHVKAYRFVFLVLAACLAGAAVSFAGLIGFVGLIVPHALRFVTGTQFGKLFPLSALYGAVFLLLCDLLARLVFAPFELPVGILLAGIGAPFFLWLLLRGRKGGKAHA